MQPSAIRPCSERSWGLMGTRQQKRWVSVAHCEMTAQTPENSSQSTYEGEGAELLVFPVQGEPHGSKIDFIASAILRSAGTQYTTE